MRRGWWVLALAVLAGCDDAGPAGSGDATDCRNAAQTCAPGFECVAVGAAWECVRGGGIDAGPADAASVRDAEPDAASDAALADAALPDAGPSARPGGPCGDDLPCVDGECRDDLPGGFCRVPCQDDAVCGPDAVCSSGGSCRTRCDDLGCRRGWACDGRDEPAVCRPDCNEIACGNGDLCNPDSGLCEPAPVCVPETCNEKDDDCDGMLDEGVQNACGGCGDVPEETCNGRDDDCDGTVDETVLNACGACGDVPEEACNDVDDDCDGEVDEGLRNACGACGPALAELCNDIDDDCDGTVDEGARNACGDCGPPAAEVCDGVDADCDGTVDEDAPCAAGQICLEGRCRQPRSVPGGPCRVDDDCAAGQCDADPIFPGGWCVVDCARDADCGADAACIDVGALACLERCGGGVDCRPGWVCYEDDGVCFPSCQNIGCGAGYLCGADGFCAIPILNITVTQVFLSPGVSDGSAWDGFSNVGRADFEAAAAAALSGNLASLTAVAAQFANAAYAPPDPFGTATLLQGPISRSLNLAEIQDTYSPQWGGISWRVALDPAADTRVRISLTDADLANDDPIGTVEVGQADLIAAQAAGRVFPVATVNQGNGHIIAVAISVRAE